MKRQVILYSASIKGPAPPIWPPPGIFLVQRRAQGLHPKNWQHSLSDVHYIQTILTIKEKKNRVNIVFMSDLIFISETKEVFFLLKR